MSDKQRHTIIRFATVFLLIALGFVAVIGKIIAIQTVERDQWLKIAGKQTITNQPIRATRGNILDCHGELLASSVPQYQIYMDTRVEALQQNGGALFYEYVDSIAEGLSQILGDKSKEDYRQIMLRAYRGKTICERDARLTLHRVSYTERKAIMRLPLVRRGYYKSGIHFVDLHDRVKPYGSLASRTIGSIYANGGYGNAGLEKQFDKELSGKDGMSMRVRKGGRWENVPIVEAIDGRDVVTTLDATIQDIAESTLRKKLEEVQADWGCCILMETKSGKIRAIVNLDQGQSGYYEKMNHAVTRVEPGSTFKTIALMAALDDGKVKLYDTIPVSREPWKYLSIKHTDAHPKDTVYTVRSALAISSNIALAKIITNGYEGSARKFIRRIEKMGLKDSVYCEIPGAHRSRIDIPNDSVTLSKMSYGYSVELSPMQIMMFYNAIANDGKMIRPYMVDRIEENGKVMKRFGTETICSSVCKDRTLRDIREALHDVVWDNDLPGTASVRKWQGHIAAYKAQSNLVHIAGKTGTAQLLVNGRYQSRQHRMTFVGYFPEEEPEYTCICMIEHPRNYPSYDAGYDCGGVVRQIAEKVVAYGGRYRIGKEGVLQLEIDAD